MPELPSSTAPTTPQKPAHAKPIANRGLKQFGLFMGGAVFLGLSSIITRRALARKHWSMQPRYFQDAPSHQPKINGGVEAAEALMLATLNVASVATVAVGGTLWALDISTLEEARAKMRKQMGGAVGPPSETDKEADKEIEEWFKETVLAKKSYKAMAEELAKGPPGYRGPNDKK